MPTIGFWNLQRKGLVHLVAKLCRQYEIDVLVLAELGVDELAILNVLNDSSGPLYFSATGFNRHLNILSRFPQGSVLSLADKDRTAMRHVTPPLGPDFLMVATHLPSKLYKNESDQIFSCIGLATATRDAENKVGHSRSIIIGDLNVDPFETGVAAAGGLHAIMDRKIAAKGARMVDHESHLFFYNPMWNFYGDCCSGPCGTYYYAGGTKSFFWHLFDQVLIRPELLPFIRGNPVRIITEIDSISLCKQNGQPNDMIYSDHFPILLHLDLVGELKSEFGQHVGQSSRFEDVENTKGLSAGTSGPTH